MPGCYLCGVSLPKGQGIRRSVRTGTSVAGLHSTPPSLLLAVLARGKMPSIRTFFALRTLCPPCTQRLDAPRSLRRNVVLFGIGLILLVAIAALLTGQR
jgi:hypothetical protein